jgi:hypothetical protein
MYACYDCKQCDSVAATPGLAVTLLHVIQLIMYAQLACEHILHTFCVERANW